MLNKFSEDIWKKEEEKFKKAKIKVPTKNLYKVDSVILREEKDFDRIPGMGGCYWIWTNEPVNHRFHKNRIPAKVKGGEIIYNGIAKEAHFNLKRNALLFLSARRRWAGVYRL